MKILIIQTFPAAVNSQSVSYNRQEIGLAKALNRLGHRCDVAYFGGRHSDESEFEYEHGRSFTVYHLKGWNLLKNGIFKGLRAMAGQYDIIQPGEYDQLQTWLLARWFPGKVVVYHGPYYDEFNKGYNTKCRVFDLVLLRTYIRKQTPFLTKSNFASEFLADKHIGSVRTVGVGLDVEQISKTTAEPHPTVQKICNSKDRHLLYVGRIEPRRNITSMFDVFRAVRTDFPDARLVVIGDGEEGYVRKCFEHADSIGVSDWIIHEKKLTQGQLPDLYRACDAFLLPTLYEIFGMVLLEAMFFGCPVITSINGGSDVLIRHRENGMVVDGHDIKKWMEAISEVLNDSEFASALGASARDTICRHFTWERLAGSFVDAYQQANESPNRGWSEG